MAKTLVACPRCGNPVEWTPESKYRPFCSERCKTRDLGAWANEEYRIAGGQAEDDSELDSRDEPPAS